MVDVSKLNILGAITSGYKVTTSTPIAENKGGGGGFVDTTNSWRAVDNFPRGTKVSFVENLSKQYGYENGISTWSIIS